MDFFYKQFCHYIEKEEFKQNIKTLSPQVKIEWLKLIFDINKHVNCSHNKTIEEIFYCATLHEKFYQLKQKMF